MARPPKLTPEQKAEINIRRMAGEPFRSIAKDFGVDESTVRNNVSPQLPQVRDAAEKMAAAKDAVAALPLVHQQTAMSLADSLRNISASLAASAELGSKTSHRLQALANSEVSKIDDANPMASSESLKGVAILTKLANEASHIGLNLLAANRERGRPGDDTPAALPGAAVPVFNITLAGE